MKLQQACQWVGFGLDPFDPNPDPFNLVIPRPKKRNKGAIDSN